MKLLHESLAGYVPMLTQRSGTIDLVFYLSHLSSRHRTLHTRSCGSSAHPRDATSGWQSSTPRAACRQPGGTLRHHEGMGAAAGRCWRASTALQQALLVGAALNSRQACGNFTSCRGVAHSASSQAPNRVLGSQKHDSQEAIRSEKEKKGSRKRGKRKARGDEVFCNAQSPKDLLLAWLNDGGLELLKSSRKSFRRASDLWTTVDTHTEKGFKCTFKLPRGAGAKLDLSKGGRLQNGKVRGRSRGRLQGRRPRPKIGKFTAVHAKKAIAENAAILAFLTALGKEGHLRPHLNDALVWVKRLAVAEEFEKQQAVAEEFAKKQANKQKVQLENKQVVEAPPMSDMKPEAAFVEGTPRSVMNPKAVLNTWLIGEVQEMIQKQSIQEPSNKFRLFHVEEFQDGFICTLKLPRDVLRHLGFQPDQEFHGLHRKKSGAEHEAALGLLVALNRAEHLSPSQATKVASLIAAFEYGDGEQPRTPVSLGSQTGKGPDDSRAKSTQQQAGSPKNSLQGKVLSLSGVAPLLGLQWRTSDFFLTAGTDGGLFKSDLVLPQAVLEHLGVSRRVCGTLYMRLRHGPIVFERQQCYYQ